MWVPPGSAAAGVPKGGQVVSTQEQDQTTEGLSGKELAIRYTIGRIKRLFADALLEYESLAIAREEADIDVDQVNEITRLKRMIVSLQTEQQVSHLVVFYEWGCAGLRWAHSGEVAVPLSIFFSRSHKNTHECLDLQRKALELKLEKAAVQVLRGKLLRKDKVIKHIRKTLFQDVIKLREELYQKRSSREYIVRCSLFSHVDLLFVNAGPLTRMWILSLSGIWLFPLSPRSEWWGVHTSLYPTHPQSEFESMFDMAMMVEDIGDEHFRDTELDLEEAKQELTDKLRKQTESRNAELDEKYNIMMDEMQEVDLRLVPHTFFLGGRAVGWRVHHTHSL